MILGMRNPSAVLEKTGITAARFSVSVIGSIRFFRVIRVQSC